MKNKFLSLTLLMFVTTFALGQNKVAEYKELLIGKWEYNVAYDTLAVANNGKEESENFFFTDMKIKETQVKISVMAKKWQGKWEIKNNNEFFIYLNNKTLKYYITKLKGNNLELQSFGVEIPTLGYRRK